MNAVTQLVARLRAIFGKKKLDSDMAEEMRLHLERRTQANLAAGLPPDEARDAARRQFGGVDQLQEIAREERGTLWLEEFGRDLRYAGRQLVKTPGFTAIAIVTLALAIGVNSAVFGLVNAVLLRPAVALRPEELVNLFNGREGAARDFRRFSHEEYRVLRDATDTFADVAATSITSAGIGSDEGVRRTQAFFTSENYFSLLGVQPALGRFYTADECRPNANIPVVVASYALWQLHGARADFVGRPLRVNGQLYTVIGVTPEGFNGVLVFSRTDLWVPLGVFATFSAGSRSDLAKPAVYSLNVTARLATGVTLDSLGNRLPSVAQRLTAIQVEPGEGPRELHAEPPSRGSVGTQPTGGDPAVPLAIGVFSMSGCVLLIACLNLANMLLARGTGRAKEIAVRLSLGAGRGRVVRQLVVEGVVLASAGGAVGLLFSLWGNDRLVQSLGTLMSAAGESLLLNVRPDAQVIGVTFLLCLVATLFFSVGPALKASRADLVHHLKQQAGDSGGTGRLHRFFSIGHCLVMGQIALSLALLFAAGLFLRGALKAAGSEPGFDPNGTLAADLDYSLANVSPEEARRALFATLDHVSRQPGIQSTAAATFLPYSTRTESRAVRQSGAGESAPHITAVYTAVTSAYFDTAGIRLVGGRDFTAAEARDPLVSVAIVDETLALKLFPGGNALGQQIRVGPVDREIVGVCAPHRQSNKRPNLPQRVFIPYAAGHDGRVFLVARQAVTDPAATDAAAIPFRTLLRTLDPELPVLHVASFRRLVEGDFTVWLARVGATLFGLFGAIALLLAVVGVYGVKAYAVSRRTREIGIRMALGAHARDVYALLLKQGAWQVALATAGGILLSFGAGKILAGMLYQVSPGDPFALGGAAGLLAVTALLACWVPARRATKIDPNIAVRCE